MLEALARIDRNLKRLDKYMPPPPPPPVTVPPSVYQHVIGQLPYFALPLLEPNRYKCLYGGRGGGKSVGMVDALLVLALRSPIRCLCAREFQISIKDSVYALLDMRIQELNLTAYFDVKNDRIKSVNGSEFFFKGVRRNTNNIKSMAGITHLFIEEAQSISKVSWDILVPTVRLEGSEIWVCFNPENDDDIVYERFVVNPIEGAYIRQVLWSDNPYFPKVLDDERKLLQARDPDSYRHVWEGEILILTKAQVLAGKWEIDEFSPAAGWRGPFQGADFGFSVTDPTVLVRCWTYDDCLYVEYESYHYQLEIDEMTTQWKADIPDCDRLPSRGDNSRKDTISYLRRNGMPHIGPCRKGPGSVADGIAFLRSFKKIIIHPRCVGTAQEFKLYRYKINPKTQEITPVPLDMHNHAIDAIRYAIQPLQKKVNRMRVPPATSYQP